MTQKSKHRNLKKSGVAARFSALAAGLFLLIPAHACPPGTVAQKGTGWQGCAPNPGSTQPSARTDDAPAIWANRWGAIAVDMAANGTGVSAVSGIASERQASKGALQACKRKGGTQCEVRLTYHDQCAAVVTGDKVFSVTSAASVEEATRNGIDWCNRQGDTNCHSHFSDCSLAERVR